MSETQSIDLVTALAKAVISFVAVNIDEFVVLIVFFARVDHTEFKNIHVISGQLFGFTIIFLISALGILLGTFLPFEYIALLGFLPLVLGLYELYKVMKFWISKCKSTTNDSNQLKAPLLIDRKLADEEGRQTSQDDPLNDSMSVHSYHADIILVNGKIEIRDVPPEIASAMSNKLKNDKTGSDSSSDNESNSDSDSDDEVEKSLFATYIRPCLSVILNPNTLKVTLTILADGSEEIAVFMPLLATSSPAQIVVITVTFYVLILLQCFLAYQLIQCKYIGAFLSRYSKNVVPFVLIGLGLYILSDSILAAQIMGS